MFHVVFNNSIQKCVNIQTLHEVLNVKEMFCFTLQIVIFGYKSCCSIPLMWN